LVPRIVKGSLEVRKACGSRGVRVASNEIAYADLDGLVSPLGLAIALWVVGYGCTHLDMEGFCQSGEEVREEFWVPIAN
jgi:hypothetical protein